MKLDEKKQMDINVITFIQYEYSFTFDDWNNSIKKILENKMDQIHKILLSKNHR